MTDYVISEDKLSAMEIILKQCGIPMKRNVLLTEIRSRLLEAELKKEREKYDPILEHMIALCDEIIEKQDPQSRWGFNSLLIKRKIEFLRGEP
jgi:hypothetical protein